YINDVCRTLREEMKRAGIHAEVHAWQKHLASISRKLEYVPRQSNENPLSQLHDLVSFRILVDTDNECYLALGHIHALWRPKDGRIKDFIATPKLNGYQSLHTTVFCLHDCLAEIQIRTHDMQRTATYGIASFWYLKDRMGKEGSPNSWKLSYKEMVTWIEQLRQWQQELPESADEFVEAFKGDVFQDQIFVFTPKGEVKDLPRGSTPLDMAYRIHTDLGDHCAGARIITNMDESGCLVTRQVPLDYELKGGEIVALLTNPAVHPTRDWLHFARTNAARNKIRRYLKTYERESQQADASAPVPGCQTTTMTIHAQDRPGLFRDLTAIFADGGINIGSVSSTVQERSRAIISLSFHLPPSLKETLRALLHQIQALHEIEHVALEPHDDTF
ncbi:GTP pyrophosphokinase, partial [Thermosporothrix hazakensis]